MSGACQGEAHGWRSVRLDRAGFYWGWKPIVRMSFPYFS